MSHKFSISPAIWIIIIVSILIGGYFYWFFTYFDKVIEEVDIGATKEARSNPFFAAQQFLHRTGKTASTQKNFSVLEGDLDSFGTLIIQSSRVGLSKNKISHLKDWLENGGHLVLLATELYDDELETSRDRLLDELGVRLYENPEDYWSQDNEEQYSKLTFEDTDVVTTVNFEQGFYLQDTEGKSTFIGGNEYLDLFAQYSFSEGMITIVTDMDIWKNYSIDEHDHAMFLHQLVGGAQDVLFLYNTVQPSIWIIMKDLIPMVIISFAIFILVVLFSVSWRKGRPRADDLHTQREIMQHLEAAGEFNYRNNSGEALLNSLMTSLENRLRKSIHQYSRLEDTDKIKKLSQLVNLNKDEVSLLWQPIERTQEDFLLRVSLVQKIKRLL